MEEDYQEQKFHTKQGNNLKKLLAVAMVTIAACRTTKARNTKRIKRPRLKQVSFFFNFKNPPKKKGMTSKYIQISAKSRER